MYTMGSLMRRRTIALAMFIASSACAIGLIDSCDDRLVALTRYIEPCGTIFANCAPGDFQARAADVGDGCVDPACTVPGACGQVPLGTITEVCP